MTDRKPTKTRWPFMLRSTHERLLALHELEFGAQEEAARQRHEASEALWQQRLDELLGEVRRIGAGANMPDDYYFPPTAADSNGNKPTKRGPVEVRKLTGEEVVALAERHRNSQGRTS